MPEQVDSCDHLLHSAVNVPPHSSAGCEDCLRQGTRWVHLRLCLGCGHVGCCDSSPERHATKHFQHAGHPVIRSWEPGESWRWCYLDEVTG
jgi:CPA1 family monovalent cation:H+ antiporter